MTPDQQRIERLFSTAQDYCSKGWINAALEKLAEIDFVKERDQGFTP